MEDWAIQQDRYSVAIRVPEGPVCHATEEVDSDYSDINRFKVAHRGSQVAVIAVGNLFQKGGHVQAAGQ